MVTTNYLEKLLKLRDNFSIKVITGFRGTGKSFLLKKLAEKLISDGVAEEAVIFVDFEKTDNFADYRQLYEHINDRIAGLETAYLLFDEIENVDGWEKAVNAFFLGASVEIYITGANEKSLVDKLAPLLPDNYDVLRLYTMSFADYLEVRPANRSSNISNHFNDYLELGGLPLVSVSMKNFRVFRQLLSGMFYETLFKDVVVKYSVRSPEVFYLALNFLAKNIGKTVKSKDVINYINSKNMSVTLATLENYLKLIVESNFFVKIPRYDVNKGIYIAGEQYYCVDTGIANALTNFENLDETAIVKNVVCLELMRRGYGVCCPKIGTAAADFLAVLNGRSVCIQVLPSSSEIPLSKLLKIMYKLPDNVEKFLISIEPIKTNYGIRSMSVVDFLLNEI